METNRSPAGATDDSPEFHWWTSEVAFSAFAVATGGPTEEIDKTQTATDGSTGNKSVSIPGWYPSSVILELVPSKYND